MMLLLPWQQTDLSWSPNVEWLIKNPLFYGFWALFLLEAVEPQFLQAFCTNLKNILTLIC